MPEKLNIFVRGDPQAQPRARCRAIPTRGRNGAVRWTGSMYHPEKEDGNTMDWVHWKRRIEAEVRRVWRGEPINEPVRIDIDFYFPRPKYLMKKSSPKGVVPMAVKPDRDNCEKLVWDVLKNCRVLFDDGRVCCGEAMKWWTAIGHTPGARIVVATLDAVEQPELFAKSTI